MQVEYRAAAGSVQSPRLNRAHVPQRAAVEEQVEPRDMAQLRAEAEVRVRFASNWHLSSAK